MIQAINPFLERRCPARARSGGAIPPSHKISFSQSKLEKGHDGRTPSPGEERSNIVVFALFRQRIADPRVTAHFPTIFLCSLFSPSDMWCGGPQPGQAALSEVDCRPFPGLDGIFFSRGREPNREKEVGVVLHSRAWPDDGVFNPCRLRPSDTRRSKRVSGTSAG